MFKMVRWKQKSEENINVKKATPESTVFKSFREHHLIFETPMDMMPVASSGEHRSTYNIAGGGLCIMTARDVAQTISGNQQ